MSSWELKKLSEVADIIGGATPKSDVDEYFNGDIPWITPKDLSGYKNRYISKGERNITKLGLENSSAKLLPKGAVLFTSRAPIGYVAIADNEVSTNQGFKSLVLKDGNIPEFFYYLLKHNIPLFEARATGSTFKEVSGQVVKNTELLIPSIDIQKKIVDLVSPLDEKIELNTQINQTLEQIAQTIFKSWFIDFDPVHAKANALASGQTAEQVTQAAMAVISGKNTQELHRLQTANPEQYQQLWEIAEAFPSGFDEEGVPRGWESKKVGEVVETVGGATPSTKNEDFWLDGDISWTTPKDLSSLKSKVLLKTERKITQQGLRKISSGLLDIDTVLMSSRAPVGYLALVKTPVAINQGYIAIKKQDLLNPYYMLFWCVFNMEEIKNRSSGTTFAEISKSSFREIPIIVPSRRIVDYFRDKVSSLYDLITKNEQEVNLLGNIRDELLPKLLSGDISNE